MNDKLAVFIWLRLSGLKRMVADSASILSVFCQQHELSIDFHGTEFGVNTRPGLCYLNVVGALACNTT